MPRGATITVENSFTKGLLTEFSSMNFPENSSTDADNVVFSEFGNVTRRVGVDLEPSYQTYTQASLTSNTGVYTEFHWTAVSNDGSLSFVVQQVGDKIYFFGVSDDSLSASKKSFSISLSTFKTSGVTASTLASNACQYANGKGYLFVSHPFCNPFYVSYDFDTDSITSTQIDIEVRDFEKLDDSLEIDERPTTLSNAHKYNLYNQGWYYDAVIDNQSGGVYIGNVLTAMHALLGKYPANTDIWWVFKNGENEFDISQISRVTLGNTPAPSGHYIYNAFDIDRTAKTSITGLTSQSSGQARPSAIAFFAGRIFYAGTSAEKYGDKVYFSQIIESDDQFGKCYQVNDPTSETIFDLLDTDGGVVSIPTVAKVVSLQVINDTLIVTATNGIYAIRGSNNGPFKATDYTIEFVSNVGTVSHLSIAKIDTNLLWWNNDALYSLSKDNIGVYYEVQNVSKQTIQAIIDEVPSANRAYVKGCYNKRAQIVQWLYNDQVGGTPWQYNRILEFNVASKAFYTYTIDTSLSPRISGIVTVEGQRRSVVLEDVLDNSSAQVTNNAAADVQVQSVAFTPNSEIFKYVITGNISSGSPGFTYGEQSTIYRDWDAIADTGNYTSYMYSGYRIRGEMLRFFNSTPIAVVIKNVPDAQVTFKGVWDYGFKTSMPQELYVAHRAYYTSKGWTPGDYIVKKLRVRGRGKSLQLYFESVDDAPFDISGWSTFDTGGQTP